MLCESFSQHETGPHCLLEPPSRKTRHGVEHLHMTIAQSLTDSSAEARRRLVGGTAPMLLHPRPHPPTHWRQAKLIVTRGCWARCEFCHFSRFVPLSQGKAVPPVLGIPDAVAELQRAPAFDGVKVVTGLSFQAPLEYFTHLIQALREAIGQPVQAFSAVEVDHLARRLASSAREILTEWKRQRLDRLGPGGAELLVPSVRPSLARYRISVERWLEIHRVAHSLGLRTAAGLMFDARTTAAQIIEHLNRLREVCEGLDHIELQPLESAQTALTPIRPPRLDQLLRVAAATKTLWPDLPLHIHLRSIASADAEILLADAGVDRIIETVLEVQP